MVATVRAGGPAPTALIHATTAAATRVAAGQATGLAASAGVAALVSGQTDDPRCPAHNERGWFDQDGGFSPGMAIGLFDRDTFGSRGGVELHVGRYQRQRRIGGVDFQYRRELHGVIATLGVTSRQRRGLSNQSGRYLDDAVLAGEIEWEIRQGGCGIVRRDRAAPFPSRDGGDSLSACVIRTMKSECGATGAARVCTQAVPVSSTYRLRTVLVSRKKAATVSDAL